MAKTWRQENFGAKEPQRTCAGEGRVPPAPEPSVPIASGALFDLARPSSRPLIGAEKASQNGTSGSIALST
jgi:hypothetical protein